jgi:hypothetical protein
MTCDKDLGFRHRLGCQRALAITSLGLDTAQGALQLAALRCGSRFGAVVCGEATISLPLMIVMYEARSKGES